MPTRASRTSLSHTTDTAAIDAYVAAQMQSMRIPGLALSIVKDNQVIYLRGYGVADPAGRPVTPQTPFIVGSITKSFTALALMQLVEQGKVELDAHVQRYIPWFRFADPDASARLSLRHLLYHTSGISRYVGRELLAGQGDTSLEQRVRELSTFKPLNTVGEVFEYSNANYLVVGLIIEVVSGQSYGEYIREHIFTPLQMHHSFVSETSARQDGMTRGYRWWFGVPFPANIPYLPDALPAGFLLSSAEDMAHYLIAHINGGQCGEVSILSPAGITELHRAEAVVAPDVYYGMGWVAEPLYGVPVLSHCGDTANFHSDMVIMPDSRWGIIILVNANNALVGQVEAIGNLGTWRITAGVADLLLGRQPPTGRLNAGKFYAAFNAVIAMLSVLQVWSLVRLLRHWRQPFPRRRLDQIRRVALPLVYEFVVPLGVLTGFPKWTGASWSVLRLYAPDLAYWSLIMLPLLLITGILRAVLIFFKRHYPAMNGRKRRQHRME